MKKNIQVRRIHWEKRPIKHTPSFQFEFVSIVGSKSVALCFGFYGTQVQLHMNFQAHNQKSSRICDKLVANFEPCSCTHALLGPTLFISIFFPWMANSQGLGHLSCQMPHGGDKKMRANVPSSINIAAVFIDHIIKQCHLQHI